MADEGSHRAAVLRLLERHGMMPRSRIAELYGCTRQQAGSWLCSMKRDGLVKLHRVSNGREGTWSLTSSPEVTNRLCDAVRRWECRA